MKRKGRFSPLGLMWILLFSLTSCSHPSVESRNPLGIIDPLLRQTRTHLKIGDAVPDFELLGSDGKLYRLSDFRGNLILLNFWATWCPPCLEEMPSMEGLNQRFKAKSFMIIAASVDESIQTLDTFFSKIGRKPSFLVLMDNYRDISLKIFGTEKFPESFLISPEGRLLERYVGARDWLQSSLQDKIEKFLEKPQ